MPSFNKVVLIGRLTRDPEMRYTTSGLAVTTFSIAVDRRFKSQSGEKQTDFFRCKAWRQTAEFVSNYVTKGRLVAVEGRIETSEVVGQDGQKKFFTDIVCDQVELLDSNRENDGGSGGGGSFGGGNANAGFGGAPSTPAGGGTADEGNGYFPDDDMAAAPPARPARPQGAPAMNQGGGNRPAPTRAPQANRPSPRPEPAYPENDFDDSDPFADE